MNYISKKTYIGFVGILILNILVLTALLFVFLNYKNSDEGKVEIINEAN